MDTDADLRLRDALRRASAQIKSLMDENSRLRRGGAIAVIGMGCRFPGGAENPARFWELLATGRDAVGEIPPERWDLARWWDPDPEAPGKMYVRAAALLPDITRFDAPFFNITPNEAEALDPQQRLLLEVSWEAFEDAGIDARRLAGSRTGVFIGLSNYDYIQAHIHSGDPSRINAYSGSGVMFSTAAGRLAYFYDLRGPCITLDTACSSSLVAIDQAIRSLRCGSCDLALVGGVSLVLSPDSMVALCKVKALAADGRSRAFDQAAAGYGRGEGCGLLVLKRLPDAELDGDPIHAVLAGSAVNHDGRSNGLTAPNGIAQQAVIHAALAEAGLAPEVIDYVEAHGTGTALGDPIEFGALDRVFGRREAGRELMIGSVKTNIGHTEAAAGIAGVIKVVLAQHHRALPPSLHFAEPNRHIDWAASSIRVVDRIAAWPGGEAPRAAGVSSFGLSGTNAHLIVVEPAARAEAAATGAGRTIGVLSLSGASGAALNELVTRWREQLDSVDATGFGGLCAAAARRTALRERMAAVGGSTDELAAGLTAWQAERFRPDRGQQTRTKGVVFLFTGQGAQFPGMGRTLHDREPVFREAFDRCATALSDALGAPLAELVMGPDATAAALAATALTQPAMFALQVALVELWASWGVRPAAVVGHSIGEFAAAVAAGALAWDDGLRLVAERGRRMQQLPEGGAMAAVFTSADAIAPTLARADGRVVVAAVNAQELVTLAGEAASLRALLGEFARRGIEARALDVSHAFHSPLMEPMVAGFRAVAEDVPTRTVQLPLYSTVVGDQLPAHNRLDADYWAAQILQPVRFHAAVEALRRDGYDCFLEVGPGDTLAALLRPHPATAFAVSSLRRGTDDERQLATTAAVLWTHGHEVDWAAFHGPAPRRPVTLPNYPFQRQRLWLEVGPLRPEGALAPPISAVAAVAPVGENSMRMDGASTLRAQVMGDLVATLTGVTGLAPADISPAQRLMDMGLDSLMLMKLGQTVERSYGVALRMSQMFQELATLDDLAAYLVCHATILPGEMSEASASVAPAAAETEMAAAVPPPPPLPALLPADAPTLFQQQLHYLAQVAEQNLRSITELARQQLVYGAPAAPSPPETPPHTPTPAAPTAAEPREATQVAALRGINFASPVLTEDQRALVERFVHDHVTRTSRSKALTQESRSVLADWKHSLSFWGQLKEAKYPIVSSWSEGARFRDVDGNDYVDVAMGMGVHLFGHKPAFIHAALEQQMAAGLELGTQSRLTGANARLICELTGVERVAFSNTGSEVVMVALRLARAVTGRTTVAIFKGSYHGIFDGVLATEEDGAVVPIGLGTPVGMIADVVVLEYGSESALDYVARHGAALAAVLVEPVQSRNPDLQPQGFLKRLRHLTQACGTALIFDEMINGFRTLPGGAQAWFGVSADIVLYGKIVGGGMPIGVIAGKARFLDYIDGGTWDYGDHSSPQSAMIYFGGTFCRNPATMATTHAALNHMRSAGAELQQAATAQTTSFCDRLNLWFERQRVPLRAKHFSSQWRLVPVSSPDVQPIELELLYLRMMRHGVYTWERRISFFSTAHGPDDIAQMFDAITASIREIRDGGFAFSIDPYPQPQFAAPSSVQKRLFALAQRDGGQLPYHLPQAYWVDGPLDIDRLDAALRAIIRRHESLRTSFLMLDGELIAKRVAEPRFEIERLTASEFDVDRVVTAFLRPFDLAQAPLLRVAVVAVAPERHLLLADAHHIVADGFSFKVIAAELMALYEDRPLAPVGYDLRHCLDRVESRAVGERARSNDSFWRGELAGALPLLALPADRLRPPQRDFAGDAVTLTVSPEVTRRLRDLGQTRGASLYIVLLAAWSAFLHRITGQEDILIGGAVSGRPERELADAVGMFVNTVVFRTRPAAMLPFAEHLEATLRTSLAVYDHQDHPFEAIATLAGPVLPDRNPVFDTMLSYENATGRAFRTAGLTFMRHEVPLPGAMFDLLLEATEEHEALTLKFGYATSLFDRDTVARWAAGFEILLRGLPDDPARPLGRLEMLTQDERQLIAAFNATAAAYPAEATLVSLFADAVDRYGARPALRFGLTALSYAELDRESETLAASLHACLAPHARVGILLERSEQVPIAVLAVLKTGCSYVPLDPAYPSHLLAHMVNDADCRAVLTTEVLSRRLPDSLRARAIDITAPRRGGAVPRVWPKPDDDAYVIYTSGSTGQPKGCLVTHSNVVRLLVNDRHDFRFGPDDVWLCAHSFAFDFSVWELWGAWAYGGCVVIARQEEARDPAALLALVRSHRVTVLNQTPGAFYGFVEAACAQPMHDLAEHMRFVIFGGDTLEATYLQRWAALYPPERLALINMYGITETTVHVSYYRLTANDIFGPPGRNLIGRPLPETTMEVLNRLREPQPIGVAGELHVGGSGVCRGYLNRPELTAERFVTIGGSRFYRTGDLGRLRADGVLEYLGRNDHQVQIRGHRVELGAVQLTLASHPRVSKALVIDRDGPQGIKELVAYVIGDADLAADELRAYLAALLPDHMIPAHFVPLASLPLTDNFKLDRAALPAPEAVRLPTGHRFVAPRTPAEATIAEAWCEVLGLTQVGVEDNYFTLGGDSIKALQIVSRLHRAGVSVGVGQMLAAKTVAALALHAATATATSIGMAEDETTAALTPIQRWFLETHAGAPGHFNNAVLLAAAEPVDAAALQRAVESVVAKHDALRLALDLAGPAPRQRFAATLEVPVEFVVCASVALMTAHATALQATFDVTKPPLLRVVLYRLREGDRVLLLCHHLVIDGVSWRIWLEDLSEAYAVARVGGVWVTSQQSRPWRDWAGILAAAASNAELLAELPYWTAVEAAEVPPLPCDFEHSGIAVADLCTLSFGLDTEQTDRLLREAPRCHGAAPAVLLLTALAVACRNCFGLDRIRLRMEGHGREEIDPAADFSRTVGWFTSIFPLVLDLCGAADAVAAVAPVAEALARVPRKGIGYGILRYMTPPALRPGAVFGPAPEIGFNYLGQFEAASAGGLRLASEPTGPTWGAALRRAEVIDIEAVIVDGRLAVTVSYGQRCLARETVERFARAMGSALVALLGEPPDADVSPAVRDSLNLADAAVETVLALTPLQEGMLFHALSGDRGAYVSQFVYRIVGTLDLDAFAASWQHVAERHQALRAAILAPPGQPPCQVILKRRPIPFRAEDLSGLTADEREAAIAAAAIADRAQGFDLARDPPMRVVVLCLGPDVSQVIWTSHHIVMDGWSVGIIQRELMAIYEALVVGGLPILPPAPPFAHHLAWLAARDAGAARRFWTERLADCPPPSAIPGVDPAGRAAGYALTEYRFGFDATTTSALVQLAARLEVTLNTLVQTLWAVLLAGHTGSDDVIFGTIVSGRPAELTDVERMVGLFLQTVPVRVRIAAGEGFASLARRVQREGAESDAFQHLPLAELQRLGGVRRTLFDHVVVFENYPFDTPQSGKGLRIDNVRAIEQMHYDYSLVIHPGKQLDLTFTFNGNVVSDAEFVRIEAQFRALAAAVLAEPERAPAGFDLGPVVAPPQATETALAAGTVLELFELQVAQRPQAAAVAAGGRTLTYQELNGRATQLGQVLTCAGVGEDVPVAVFLRNGADYVASILAVQKARGIFVPFDVDLPARRLRTLMAQIAPAIVVTDRGLAPRLAERLDARPERLVVWQPDGALAHDVSGAPRGLADRPRPGDAMYVMFTSGSTGEPKPIVSSHAALRHFIDWERAELGVGPGVRVANLAPSTFDVSLRDIFLPLSAGGVLCVPDPELRGDATRLAAWLAAAEVEVAHVVPSLFRGVLKAIEDDGLRLPRLAHLLFAGEILRGADVEATRRMLGTAVALRNLYGPSETTLAKCCLAIGPGPVDPARAIPVGRPLPGTRVLIVKEGRLAAPGAVGEIFIASPFTPLGYFRDPTLTAERFVPCPPTWGETGTLYRTGDLGRLLADGTIEVAGRLDGQVKVNGIRIELAEIEHAVMASGEIEQTVMAAQKRNDGDNALICYYTERRPIDPAELRRRLALELPQGMIPHFLLKLGAFPLGINGKVDRRRLPKPEELVADRTRYVAPADPVEERIAAIWAEVLGMRRVGVCSPFFEIGGDSLRAIRLLTRINREFCADISIGGFFKAPTVRDMADAARKGKPPAAAGRIPALPPASDYPTSHAQRRLWVLAQMGGHPAVYSLPAAYRLDGELDADALVAALEALPARHEALRTVVFAGSAGPRQRVLADGGVRVERLDLVDLPDPVAVAATLAERHANQHFDLARGPLFTASLLRLAPQCHVLLVNLHHIVSDAWSVSLLVDETQRLVRGERLPPLRIHPKDHAGWEATWLASPQAGEERAWWHRQLAPLPDRLDLPTDRPAPPLPSYEGDRVSLVLDADDVAALRRLALADHATLFASLLTLVAALLCRYSGQTDLVLGTPVDGRLDTELEAQVGCFVNTLPLRLRIETSDTFATLLARMAQVLAAALDHRAYPFDLLVDELDLPRDGSRPPLFDVMVVLQEAGQRRLTLDSVTVERFGSDPKVAKFPLTFEFVESASGVILNLEYATDLFDRPRAERLAEHFRGFLSAAIAAPDDHVARADFLGAAERRLLTVSGQALPLPAEATVPAAFAAQVAAGPDRPAVIHEGERLSYAELDRRANAVALALVRSGVKAGDIVAVLLDRSTRLPAAFLGILKCGAVYLPLDPTYPAAGLDDMLADSSAVLVVTEPEHHGNLAERGHRLLDIAALDDAEVPPPVAPAAQDVAYLIYTSGSTGRPKGVLLEHRGAVNLALAQRHGLGIGPRHRVLQFAPSSFDASVWEMVMALLNGACLVIAGAECIRDPTAFADYVARHEVTVATLPPSYLAALPDAALASLELLITAGEAPNDARARRLARQLRCVNAYGPTETTVCATWHHLDPEADHDRPIPIGRAIANAQVLVLDPARNLAPVGVPGEIHIGGVGLARGYLGRPSLTEAAFVPHPFTPGERLYRSGDMGVVLPDGALRFLGRRDRQIKLRGHRIELAEIERTIARHPAVAEVAVVLRQRGDGGELVAYVVPDGALALDALRHELGRRLPEFMLPAHWLALDALPKLPNGKIAIATLPEPSGATEDLVPADELEAFVAQTWGAVLGHDRFGRHDRFFEIGGDSIKAIQAVGKLRAAGHEIETRAFLVAPTIAGLAARLRAAGAAPPADLELPAVSPLLDEDAVAGLFSAD
jgi:amino acid adenylation domain-containing protein/non-ribosomal peptide synthase protein (TIGR01720 family)